MTTKTTHYDTKKTEELESIEIPAKQPAEQIEMKTCKANLLLPRVCLTVEVKDQIDCYTQIASGEYSLFGLVRKVFADDGSCVQLVIEEVFLPKQINTNAHSEIHEDGLGKLIYELSKRNNGDEGRIRAWVHSHATMETFWSATDTAEMKKLIRESEDYFIYIVTNKKGSWRVKLDVTRPFHKDCILDCYTLEFDDVDYDILYPKTDCFEKCRKNFVENVYKRKYKGPSQGIGFNNRHSSKSHDIWEKWYGSSSQYPYLCSHEDIYDLEKEYEEMEQKKGDFLDPNYEEIQKCCARSSKPLDDLEVDLSKERDHYHPDMLEYTFPNVDEFDAEALWVAFQNKLISEEKYAFYIEQLETDQEIHAEDLLDDDTYEKIESQLTYNDSFDVETYENI